MNIDIATGLPELPEDYYWKVDRTYVHYQYENVMAGEWVVAVAIYRKSVAPRKRWWGGFTYTDHHGYVTSGSVQYKNQSLSEDAVTPADILRTAREVYTKFLLDVERQLRLESVQALYGAYPPKRLEI